MPVEPFLFGKLPSHGDFVARGLKPEARDVWDAWASAEIAAAQGALADRFDDAHDRAQPCRFVAGPTELTPSWRAGALAPSIDAAGRRFMVVVGFEGLTPGEAAMLGVALSDRAENLLRRALVQPLSAADAVLGIAEATPGPGEIAAAEALGLELSSDGVWWRQGDGAVSLGCAPPVGLLVAALSAALQCGGAI